MRVLLGLLLCLAACGADDWTVDGGVATRRLSVKARGLDVVPVTVVAPAGGQGPSLGKRSGFVLVPDAFVSAERYLWLARALANRGHVVAIPESPAGYATLAIDDAAVARDVLESGDRASGTPALSPRGHVAVGGHGLGGEVAATAAVDGGFGALVLLAGAPADGEPVEQLRLPVLAIAGDRDCDVPLADVRAGFRRFPADSSLLAVVAGLAHDAFTDETSADCASALAMDEAHARISGLVHDFLAAKLDDDQDAFDHLEHDVGGAP